MKIALLIIGMYSVLFLSFLAGLITSGNLNKSCIKALTDARVAAYTMKAQRDQARAEANKYKQAYINERKKNKIMQTAEEN